MDTQSILTNHLTEVLAHIKDRYRNHDHQSAGHNPGHALPVPFFGWKFSLYHGRFQRHWNPVLLFDRKEHSLPDFLAIIEPADRNHFIAAHAIPLENLFSRSYCYLMDGPLTLDLVFRARDRDGKSIGIAATSVFSMKPGSDEIDWIFVANKMAFSQSEPFRLRIRHGVSDWLQMVCEKMECTACANPWCMTPAEQEVANLLAAGESYKRIADNRKVKRSTVHTQVNGIYAKMGVNNRGSFLHMWKSQYRKFEIIAA